MLTALNINKYPYFDFSEIVPDQDLVFNPFRKIEPVRAGEVLPDFSLQKENTLWQQFFNGAEIHGPALLNRLVNKPLVIGFFSLQWHQYGIDLLKQLNTVQNDIAAQGGSLLIISSEKGRKLEKLVWDHNLSLSFYFDKENHIAEKFRIYSEDDPIWNKFSGIDTNVPLLATYVISPAGQIEFEHIDPDFSQVFPSKDIVSAVQKSDILHRKIRNIHGKINR